MGLDMYLFKRKRNYDETNEEESLGKEVAYWRKANHIRQFFVDNCDYDYDNDCVELALTKQNLIDLVETCTDLYDEYVGSITDDGQIIISDKLIEKCKEKLPTSQGFFFGGSEYDHWYFWDIYNTMRMINKVLYETDWDNEEVYYYEWW